MIHDSNIRFRITISNGDIYLEIVWDLKPYFALE